MKSTDFKDLTVVIDTKWEIPRDGRPADTDLHQKYAFNIQFGAKLSLLLYPGKAGVCDVQGCFEHPVHFSKIGNNSGSSGLSVLACKEKNISRPACLWPIGPTPRREAGLESPSKAGGRNLNIHIHRAGGFE